MKTKKNINNRLGIDIGKVIMSPVIGGKSDTSFLNGSLGKAMQTPPNADSFSSISTLVNAFSDKVWLISKAGTNIQRKTRLWLHHHKFYEHTGVFEHNLRFCLKRAQKADHCRELKITHFVDDRIDVLSHLRYCVPNLYLFGEQPGLKYIPGWVTHVLNWNEALERIIEDIQSQVLPETECNFER